MKIRATLAALALTGTTLVGAATLSPAEASHGTAASAHHACTRTSSGKCIKGGEFCPQSKYGHSGWDAKGRRYVCKGNHSHPHWMKP